MKLDTRTRILDSAEHRARRGGYDDFSFREIAAEIGIKSASVHYHFPTKEDLGAEMAARYTDRFLAALGDPADPEPRETKIARYKAAYRRALNEDGAMCLCGLFGAQSAALPPRVAAETRRFFERNRDWLVAALVDTSKTPEQDALALIARLEGAMLMAHSLRDTAVFDAAMARD